MTDQPVEKFEICLSAASLQVVGRALSDLPYRIAAPVIAEINAQLQGALQKDDNGQKAASLKPGR